jgi:DNA-binding transcriptional LysR family regulator
MMRSTPARVGRRLDRVPFVHAPADTGIFAFRVLAHDHPVELARRAMFQRRFDAGEDARGPHVRVLVEALAALQPQAPQCDVVGDVRVTRRAEQDGVLRTQQAQPVDRHHHTVLAVVIASPVEVLELEAQRAVGGGERFQHLLAGGHDFLADAVAGDHGDAIGLHADGRRRSGARHCTTAHGILMRAEWDIERHLRSGRLVQVLPQYETPDADIHAVYPQRHRLSARVRAFVDFIAAALAR